MKFPLLALASIAVTLTACSAPTPFRNEVASRIASPAWMIKRPIQTTEFTFTAYERMHEKGDPVTVYIEGDGTADRSSTTGDTSDPTPLNPVALHLASRDKSKNLAYLPRPCQFDDITHYDHPIGYKENCDAAYWGDKRFAPEVIAAYEEALDNIQNQFGTQDFHLVGYDGGGAIAAILAAKREDVLSFRTVAGNLDHNAQSVYLNLPPLEGSLNAIDFAEDLRNVPQHHYIGGQDESSKPAVLHSYLQALGNSQCVGHTLIQEAEHARGWVEKWPELLANDLPECTRPIKPKKPDEFKRFEVREPIFVPRMSGSKK